MERILYPIALFIIIRAVIQQRTYIFFFCCNPQFHIPQVKLNHPFDGWFLTADRTFGNTGSNCGLYCQKTVKFLSDRGMGVMKRDKILSLYPGAIYRHLGLRNTFSFFLQKIKFSIYDKCQLIRLVEEWENGGRFRRILK